jgi:uncharacterized membrane protein
MDIILQSVDMAWLSKAVFEANLLSLFVICVWHSCSVHGWRRTAREFTAGFVLTAMAESTGVLSGAYVYPGFQWYILATPIANPASWVALIYIIMVVTDRIVSGPQQDAAGLSQRRVGSPAVVGLIGLAVVDATIALSLDLVLDPLATIYNWWIWVPDAAGVHTIGPGVVEPYNFQHHVWMTTPDNPVADFFAPFFEGGHRYPTRVLGIPLINFVAWFVFVFVFTFQTRWVESRQAWGHLKRSVVLAGLVLVDGPVLALLLISPNL